MKGKTNRVRFNLNISPEAYLVYYRGEAEYVIVRTHNQTLVKFPARYLRRFISHDGIHGEFEIEYGQDNRFKDMRRIR
ncbi:MAG TPA: DUF2835 family protein [Syntrophales bacterium]|nr:DUF2835 family protein [Syntrophales bacterium]